MFFCTLHPFVRALTLATEQMVLGETKFDKITSEAIRKQCVTVSATFRHLLIIKG
jgi:hypothetical protein